MSTFVNIFFNSEHMFTKVNIYEGMPSAAKLLNRLGEDLVERKPDKKFTSKLSD